MANSLLIKKQMGKNAFNFGVVGGAEPIDVRR